MKQSRFCDTALVATTVDYPFAYRTEKESNNAGLTKLVTTKVYHVKHDNRDSTIKNKTFLKRIFSSKVLVLLAVGFITGSVFPFVVPCIVDSTAAPVTVVPEEFLTDEVVKNLARENQVHEKEISKLKQQVKIQSIQQGIIERLEGTIDADPQQSQEANLDIEHPDNEAIILGRVNEKTGQFELYDHNEHRYKPIQQRRLRASSKLAA